MYPAFQDVQKAGNPNQDTAPLHRIIMDYNIILFFASDVN